MNSGLGRDATVARLRPASAEFNVRLQRSTGRPMGSSDSGIVASCSGGANRSTPGPDYGGRWREVVGEGRRAEEWEKTT